MFFICGSSDAGAVNYFNSLKKLMLNPSYTSGQFSKGFSGSGNRIAAILKELFL